MRAVASLQRPCCKGSSGSLSGGTMRCRRTRRKAATISSWCWAQNWLWELRANNRATNAANLVMLQRESEIMCGGVSLLYKVAHNDSFFSSITEAD